MPGGLTDVGIGTAILFGLLATGSIVLTFIAPTQTWSAIGFTAAIGFSSLVLVTQHWAGTNSPSNSH